MPLNRGVFVFSSLPSSLPYLSRHPSRHAPKSLKAARTWRQHIRLLEQEGRRERYGRVMGGMTGGMKNGKLIYLKVFPAIDGRDGGFSIKTTIFPLLEPQSVSMRHKELWHSHAGNRTFPHWEHGIPSVGRLSLFYQFS